MHDLTQHDLATFRARLSAELDRLLGPREPEPVEAGGDLQDRAAREADSTRRHDHGDLERGRIDEIQAALQRLDAGTFGICELSGEPIPLARLHADPAVRYTLEAQQELEQERREERDRGKRDHESPY